ncbi:hypothetical protein F4803DRAFT_565277 [Xylaria telfairii]|nr:hypothetical protein F4803DRAFT_565277 [Xylaria telfairii]
MDIIITGASGFVGGAVVRRALINPLIGHIFILSRRPLPSEISDHEKVTFIHHTDFCKYSRVLLERLVGCEACIWCIGGQASRFPDKRTAKLISVDCPVAAAISFMTNLAPWVPHRGKFRFVFVSTHYAEWSRKKPMFFMRETRLMKGSAEKRLLAVSAYSQNTLDVVIARPARIMAKEGGWIKSTLAKLTGFIAVDHLAANLLEMAAEGSDTWHSPIVEAKDLIQMRFLQYSDGLPLF